MPADPPNDADKPSKVTGKPCPECAKPANPATLRPIVQPVPRENAPNGLSVVPAAAPAWAAPAPADPDAGIRKQLEAHGVVSSKLDTLPDGVRLTVMVPKGNDATRFLEATGRDFNAAAQAILQKLGN